MNDMESVIQETAGLDYGIKRNPVDGKIGYNIESKREGAS